MRTRHVGNLHDMLVATPQTLADEYLSTTQAVDHEFRSEAERSRYAALVHVCGMHLHDTYVDGLPLTRHSGRYGLIACLHMSGL